MDNSDENVGWPSYVDFLSTFIFVLILFIGSLVFQISGVIAQHKRTQILRAKSDVITRAGIRNIVRQNKILIPLNEQVNFSTGSALIDVVASDHLRNVGKQ